MAADKRDPDFEDRDITGRDANEDPITGEPGAHPVGVGLGTAAGGAAAGAAVGAFTGPVGAAIGTVAGGIAGGLAGKAIAEQVDPTVEEAYWRDEYPNREYYDPTVGYPEVGPAYRYGWDSRARHHDRTWEDAEPELASNWPNERGESGLEWERARPAVHDAWKRIDDSGLSLEQERDRQPSEAEQAQSRPPRVPK
jgi:hypothetical protein